MYYFTRHWSACYRCTAVLQVTVHMGLPAARSSTGKHPPLRADVKVDEQDGGAQNVQFSSDFRVHVFRVYNARCSFMPKYGVAIRV